MTRQVVLFLDQRKRGERKPRRSDACKRRANRRQHCTIILGVVISESLHCPMIALLFSSISLSTGRNPQKSTKILRPLAPPSSISPSLHPFAMQPHRRRPTQNRKIPTESSTSSAHQNLVPRSPDSLTPPRQQSSRMCDNAAHHTPQCNHNSHSELET